MRAPTSAIGRLLVATSLALSGASWALTGMAGATGASHEGPTTVSLRKSGPSELVEPHEAGAGEWVFRVTGNKQAESVGLRIFEAPAGGCGADSETFIYADKVTNDELAVGPATRTVSLSEGSYCTYLALDGRPKGEATITTEHPEPVEPEVSASPSNASSVSPSSSPSPEPTEPDVGSKEYDRCSDDPEVDHRVLAGATGPEPNKPFIYQKYYPSTLQVHSGDLVEWCFNASYDWHTVTFLPTDMDRAQHPESDNVNRPRIWRWDETGQLAFDESFLFGQEGGDVSKQCGRGEYYHVSAQDPCVLGATDQKVSSALWDRFFSMTKPGTFRSVIDLPAGSYRYHCNIHSSMEGRIDVLPAEVPTDNPSPREIDEEIAADHAEADEVYEELSDPSDSYDFEKRRWTVHVGAQTPDRSVAIEQFLPSRIDIRKGDSVHFVARTDEPNTVTFPGGRQVDGVAESDLQGGFSVQGRCGPHSCDAAGKGAPWGMTGLGFAWVCDPDGRASGAPGLLPYIPAATAGRTNGASQAYGCVAGGLPEMIPTAWYGSQQRAPGDLVTHKTFHNSGVVLDEALPDWYRTWPASGALPSGTFPNTFDAKFPTDGTFKYFCAAHEFMNGVVVVKP